MNIELSRYLLRSLVERITNMHFALAAYKTVAFEPMTLSDVSAQGSLWTKCLFVLSEEEGMLRVRWPAKPPAPSPWEPGATFFIPLLSHSFH